MILRVWIPWRNWVYLQQCVDISHLVSKITSTMKCGCTHHIFNKYYMYDRVRFFHDWDRGEAEISIMKKTYSIKLRVRYTHPMQFQLHQNSRYILILRKFDFISHITPFSTLYDNIYYIGLRIIDIHKK